MGVTNKPVKSALQLGRRSQRKGFIFDLPTLTIERKRKRKRKKAESEEWRQAVAVAVAVAAVTPV
jgi:hypothetical protein